MRASYSGTKVFLATATAAIALTAAVSQARVFFRTPSSSAVGSIMESAGGARLYRSPVTINGARANLEIHGFAMPLATVLRDLRARMPLENVTYAGGTMAEATWNGERAVRLLLIHMPNPQSTVAFCIDYEPANGAALTSAPPTHGLRSVPAYPGSQPTFFAEAVNDRVAMAVATTVSSPAEVLQFYATRLAADGWAPAVSAQADTSHPESFQVFLKGPDICAVLATPAEGAGRSGRIMLLHKQTGLR